MALLKAKYMPRRCCIASLTNLSVVVLPVPAYAITLKDSPLWACSMANCCSGVAFKISGTVILNLQKVDQN